MARVREAVWEVALDWLAVGLEPQRSALDNAIYLKDSPLVVQESVREAQRR